MNLALRPYATAGIALVGASVIAVTPIAAAPNTAARMSSAEIQLNALVNPIEQWAEIGQHTAANLAALQDFASPSHGYPFPILRQLSALATTRGQVLATAFQDTANKLGLLFSPDNPDGVPAQLNAALAKLTAGDPKAAVNGAYAALMTIVNVGGFGLAGPIGTAITQPVDDLAKVWDNVPLIFTSVVGFGALAIMAAGQEVVASALGDLTSAAQSGDPQEFANAIISLPGKAFDGVLNGNAAGSGILGNGGLALQIISVPRIIARALGAPRTYPTAAAVASGDLTAADEPRPLEIDAPPAEREAAPVAIAAPNEAPLAIASSTATGTSDEPTAEVSAELAKPTVRGSLVATPGKTNTQGATKPAAKVASDFRDGISSTVNKIGESVKKAFTKPEKKSASATSSDKGPGSSSSSDPK